MVIKKIWMAALAVAVMTGGWQVGHALGTPAPQQANDSSNWQAPRGYGEFYQENGTPNMVARQGYAAGFTQGESDLSRSRNFDPSHAKFYKDVPSSPKGLDRNSFVLTYREAFAHGYTRGFNK